MYMRRHLFPLLLLVSASMVAFGQDKTSPGLKVGHRGTITIETTLKMDGVTLEPGEYMLQHRVIGSDHYVRFHKMEGSSNPSEAYPQLVPTDEGVVKCKVERAGTKFKETRVITEKKGTEIWVTRVEVEGEKVVHIIP